MTKNNVEEGGV